MNIKNLGKLSYIARATFKPTVNNTFKLINGIGQQKFRSLSGIPKRSIGVLPPTSVPEPANGVPVHVKAYFIARGIDIMRLANKLYPSSKQNFQSKCVTIQINENLNQHISVFSYGSVVFYNIPEEDHSSHIRMIKTMSILPISEVLQFNESYKLLIHENLEEPSVIHAEHLNIRELDNSNITIVSAVMSQTVAMDWYAANVDNTIERFTIMNMNVQESGAFKNLKETELFKIVASNNSVFTNVLSKLGFFEGNEVAWESAEYYSTWEALRKEFELDSRYHALSLKVNIVNEDARLYLDVLQHQKSTQLEWIIIILIAAEIVIGVTGLSLQYYDMLKQEQKDKEAAATASVLKLKHSTEGNSR